MRHVSTKSLEKGSPLLHQTTTIKKRKKKEKNNNNIRNNRRKRRYIGNEPGVRTLLLYRTNWFSLFFSSRGLCRCCLPCCSLYGTISYIHISKYKEKGFFSFSPLFFYFQILYFTLVRSLSGQCSLIEARASQRNRMNTIKLVSIRSQSIRSLRVSVLLKCFDRKADSQ